MKQISGLWAVRGTAQHRIAWGAWGLALAAALTAPAQAADDKATRLPRPLSRRPSSSAPARCLASEPRSGTRSTAAASRNVTVATLTPFLPDPAKATGAAVVVAPGGGFMSLSMDNEGWDVARPWRPRALPPSSSSTA